ncbi:hypothetical protein O4H48_14405 [Rhodobacteraceae bacterium G21628-S1]|nr:hypothetical protein [Rhodobacteraceae bacterium G21628-S1]
MVNSFEDIIEKERPALLIGNGINRHNSNASSSWDELLAELARQYGLKLTKEEASEMSNTEFFDILDLARPKEKRSSLQEEFCSLMKKWEPSDHHAEIVNWARRSQSPIMTVNFDENLSKAAEARFFRRGEHFTHYYPWSSYFSDHEIRDPRSSFAIWHPHGMMRYKTSVRLGLTHYMGSVQRARPWVYKRNGLRFEAKVSENSWRGSNTWLDVLFFCPIMIFGFGFGKDENFFRWLFLERARLHKLRPNWKAKTWFIDTGDTDRKLRRPFFEGLDMEIVTVPDYSDIYENPVWRS